MRRTLTGWWFGPWILFFHILGNIGNNHPNWRTHIFQRGWTTNQIMKPKHKVSSHSGTLERFWPKEHTKASHLSNAPNARTSWAMAPYVVGAAKKNYTEKISWKFMKYLFYPVPHWPKSSQRTRPPTAVDVFPLKAWLVGFPRPCLTPLVLGTWWFWGLVLIALIKTGKEKVQLGRGLSADRVFPSFWILLALWENNSEQ